VTSGNSLAEVKIPVFVSAPTSLSDSQERSRQRLVDMLDEFGFEPRALGRKEYPTDYPLREVAVIAKHCSGAVILGFEQFRSLSGFHKLGTSFETASDGPVSFPSAWNNLEAGILFGLRLPLLIFKEAGISGGVFDNGVTDVFVHRMPEPERNGPNDDELREVVLRWQSKVRERYYAFE
jgi:hypothetical protein